MSSWTNARSAVVSSIVPDPPMDGKVPLSSARARPSAFMAASMPPVGDVQDVLHLGGRVAFAPAGPSPARWRCHGETTTFPLALTEIRREEVEAEAVDRVDGGRRVGIARRPIDVGAGQTGGAGAAPRPPAAVTVKRQAEGRVVGVRSPTLDDRRRRRFLPPAAEEATGTAIPLQAVSDDDREPLVAAPEEASQIARRVRQRSGLAAGAGRRPHGDARRARGTAQGVGARRRRLPHRADRHRHRRPSVDMGEMAVASPALRRSSRPR